MKSYKDDTVEAIKKLVKRRRVLRNKEEELKRKKILQAMKKQQKIALESSEAMDDSLYQATTGKGIDVYEYILRSKNASEDDMIGNDLVRNAILDFYFGEFDD